MIELRTKDGTCYTLADNGAVVARSDGPKGWNYSGKWIIVGFKTRWNAHHTIPLADALNGTDTGQGWIVDLDHGTKRLWSHPTGRRLASVRRIEG